MVNPSHEKGNVSARAPRVEACIQDAMEKYAGGSPGRDLTYYQNVHQDLAPLARELENALSIANVRIAELERATPPSPSTAPEVDELPAPPTLPRYLLDMIGEYGMARTDSVGQLEVQHRWEILIGGIKRYASEYGRALASRPAEVDDEGLPPLPAPALKTGDFFPDGAQHAGCNYFTAEQYRQGQRDAVAADRARRGDGWISVEDRLPAKDVDVLVYLPNNGDPLIEMDAWGEIHECPVSFSSHSICVGEGWGNNDFDDVSHWMLMPAAPSHTTNKEKGMEP